MDTILVKASFLFSFLLSVVLGTSIITITSEKLTLDFKTGDSSPIIETVAVTNNDTEIRRFDITNNEPWIFTYRENQKNSSSVELSSGLTVNFILEIHPEFVADGVTTGIVTINAVDLFTFMTLESKDISVTLNKNITETPSPTPEIVQPTLTPIPTVIEPTVTPVPAPSLPILSPTESEEQNRGSSISQPNQDDLGEIGTVIPLLPEAETITSPLPSPLNEPLPSFLRSFFDSIWSLIKTIVS